MADAEKGLLIPADRTEDDDKEEEEEEEEDDGAGTSEEGEEEMRRAEDKTLEEEDEEDLDESAEDAKPMVMPRVELVPPKVYEKRLLYETFLRYKENISTFLRI